MSDIIKQLLDETSPHAMHPLCRAGIKKLCFELLVMAQEKGALAVVAALQTALSQHPEYL